MGLTPEEKGVEEKKVDFNKLLPLFGSLADDAADLKENLLYGRKGCINVDIEQLCIATFQARAKVRRLSDAIEELSRELR